jgi:dTDP-4-dehydrorhamnose 3,5-epimerase
MLIKKTKIQGLFLIQKNYFRDSRGIFYRAFCKKELQKISNKNLSVQSNVCVNKKKGTLRGLHYQTKPFQEDKIISCIQGAIFDVVLDLRKKSKTYLQHQYFYINKKNYISIFVPKGCAHGYLTLESNTVVLYYVSNYYDKKQSKGIRYDDPILNIKWPIKPKIISSQDKSWPLLKK